MVLGLVLTIPISIAAGVFALVTVHQSLASVPGTKLFGTDGVRGRANSDLSPELALSVARAAASS